MRPLPRRAPVRAVPLAGAVVAVTAAFALGACGGDGGTASDRGAGDDRPIPTATSGDVDGSPDGLTVRVRNGADAAFERCLEVADSEPERNVGLSGRDAGGIGDGMLFRFPTTERRPFWMLDTRVPLLLAPIGADMRIAEVLAMQPCPPEDASSGGCRLYEPAASYAQAIEVAPAALTAAEVAAFVPGAEVVIGGACRPRV